MYLLYLMISTVFISFFIIGLVINSSIVTKKFKTVEFSITCINLFICVLACVFNSQIAENEVLSLIVFFYAIALYLIFGVFLYTGFISSMLKDNHYHMLIETIKSTRFNIYIIVDAKDKIKEISSGMLDEIGMSYEEVIGKKFFDIFERGARFTKFNGAEITNKDLREYYKTYKFNVKKGQEDKREYVLSNYKSQDIVLNIIEQPVFVFNHYRGRLWIGEKKSNETLLKAEAELSEKTDELVGIKEKFMGVLELTHENIFFIDLSEKYIWINDNYKKLLGLNGNTLALSDFRSLMSESDAFAYTNKLAELTKREPNYTMKYRIIKNDGFIWITERGKRVFDDSKSNIVLGFVDTVKSNTFEKIGIEEIDSCLSDKELYEDVERLYNERRTFELFAVRIKNIPEINDKYGRNVGNIVIGEYIKTMLNKLKTESSGIYRISGIDFVLTITDPRKMNLLSKAFSVERAPLNMSFNYGSFKIEVEARAGIALSSTDADNAEVLISCVKRAVRIASTDGFEKNCCYYRDVR